LNNTIIDKATDRKKQADFMSNLDEKERNKAKTLLLKKIDITIDNILELKADIKSNGITCHIYDFSFNETDTFFKPVKENINIIDFLIGKEIDRLIDISLFLIPATPNLIDFKEE